MYDAQYFFLPNSLNRQNVSSRNKFVTNADGSVDLYLQSDNPDTGLDSREPTSAVPATMRGQMKERVCRFGRLLLFLVISVNLGAYAQVSSKGVEFKMTHTFVVANTTFPASSYNIKPVPGNPYLLTIDGAVDHSAYFLVEPVDAPTPSTKTELTFQKHRQIVNAVEYGYSLYLTEVRIKGGQTYYLVVTDLPEEMANENVTVPGRTK